MTTYEEWKEENWDRSHKDQDMTALTGSNLNSHLKTLIAEDLFGPNCQLLCIGVGCGVWVHEASESTKNIWCFDISKYAEECLPECAKFTTDPKKLPSNTFDLALSLWVAPHMSNFDLQEQLNEVIRSLKPTGTFAIHYKEPLENSQVVDNREGMDDEWKVARAAGMLRRREHFHQMVSRAGGTMTIVSERPSQFHKMIEVVAHIKRGNV